MVKKVLFFKTKGYKTVNNLNPSLLKLSYVLIIFAVMVKPLLGQNISDMKRTEKRVFESLTLKFKKQKPCEEYKKYLNLYSIKNEKVTNYYGTFKSTGFKIFSQLFIQEKSSEIVIIAHGYLDHSGSMKFLVNRLLDEGYSVALFDLPGHGLSDGKRGEIDDFTQYVSVLSDFIELIRDTFNGKIHLSGHSTGCSVIYDYINHKRWNRDKIGKIIFVAPLVRSYMYRLSKAGFYLTGSFVDGFNRNFAKGPSNDLKFCDFVENKDPLQLRFIPKKWLRSLFKWNKRVKSFSETDKEILLLQGRKDRVVDYEFNIGFLRKRANLKVEYYDDGKHHLINEIPEIREKIIQKIVSYLNEKQ